MDGEYCRRFRLANNEILVIASSSLLWISPLQTYEKGQIDDFDMKFEMKQ